MSTTRIDWKREFSQASTDPAAGRWALRVQMKMMMAGATVESINQVLGVARDEVRATGTSPVELYGAADDFAAEQVGELSMAGATFSHPGLGYRDALQVGLWAAVLFAVGFGVVGLVDGPTREWSPGDVVALLCVVVASMVFVEVWGRLARRQSQMLAGLLAAFAATPFMVLPAVAYRRGSWGVHSTWWWFVLAALFVGLALLAGRFMPSDGIDRVQVRNDDDWLDQAEAALRRRDDLSGTQVRERLDEAKAHAAQSGTSLLEEFGNPLGFAGSLPSQPSVGLRNSAILSTANLLAVGALVLTSGREPWHLVLLGVVTLASALMWFAWFASRKEHR